MSFAQQGPLLADYIRSAFTTNPDRVAMIATDTANYDDAVSAFVQAFRGVRIFRPNQNERGASRAGSICTGGMQNYDVVYVLTSLSYFLELAHGADCRPHYVGVGMTLGLDQVADLGCQAPPRDRLRDYLHEVLPGLIGPSTAPLIGAHFFSPAPAFQDSNLFDPGFLDAIDAEGVSSADDIMWMLWGFAKVLRLLLEAPGPAIDRRGLVDAAEALSAQSGVFPDLSFSRSDHFGAQQVHLLRVVCERRGNASGYLATEQAFAAGF